jgi:hypothetical protein
LSCELKAPRQKNRSKDPTLSKTETGGVQYEKSCSSFRYSSEGGPNGGVVSREASFHEQFLDVPIRKREPQIPPHPANNDLGFEVPPFEQRWTRFDHGIFCSLSGSFTEFFATQPQKE